MAIGRTLLLIAGVGLAICAFQNCSNGFEVLESSPESSLVASSPASYSWPSFAPIFSAGLPFKWEGCNTVSYGSTPNFGALMIGRVMNGDPVTSGQAGACPGSSGTYDQNQSLTLVRMIWADGKPSGSSIPAGTTIAGGTCKTFGRSRVCLETRGRLVIYDSRNAELWSTDSLPSNVPGYSGRTVDRSCTASSCLASFQGDGNVVLYDQNYSGSVGTAYWATGTGGNTGASYLVSEDNPYLWILKASGETLYPQSGASYLYKILDTSAAVSIEQGQHTIVSAYDSSIAPFNGEYWVSFECALSDQTVSSCMGPIEWDAASNQMRINRDRISVVVLGKCVPGQPDCVAATVPKLLSFNSRFYLYWDDLHYDNTKTPQNDWANSPNPDGQMYFKSIDARATELAVDQATGRMYVQGSSTGVLENDDQFSHAVMKDIDVSQVVSVGDRILLVGSRTQAGSSLATTCAMPLNNVTDCYRLSFALSGSPLGPFNVSSSDGLPAKAMTYTRFVYRPDNGETMLIGGVNYDVTSRSPLQFASSNSGYPWPDKILAPVCDPISKPYPAFVESAGHCIVNPSLH